MKHFQHANYISSFIELCYERPSYGYSLDLTPRTRNPEVWAELRDMQNAA